MSNIRERMDELFSELSGFEGSDFMRRVRGQIGTLGVNRGAERASRRFSLSFAFTSSAFASNHSSVKACKCSNGLTFKRHLK